MAKNPQWPLIPRCTNPLEFEYVEQWVVGLKQLRTEQQLDDKNRAQLSRFIVDQIAEDRADRLKRFSGYFIVPIAYNCAFKPDSIRLQLGWAITWPCIESDEVRQLLVSSVSMHVHTGEVEPPGLDIYASGTIASAMCRALAAAQIARHEISPECKEFEDKTKFGI